jgi:hypothetical protein
VTVKRHFRFVGGDSGGKRTPPWVWVDGRREWKIPAPPKPQVTLHCSGDPVTVTDGPAHETYELVRVPLTRGWMSEPIYVECWAQRGLDPGSVRERFIEDLLDQDSPL